MRHSVEAGSSCHSGPYENGLSEILDDVVEEVRLAINRDVSGADLLFGLLSAPWLHSLLRIYECLIRYRVRPPSPYLPYASGLSQEVLANLRGVVTPSAEARELFGLLSKPHMQALLSAHDSVAQRNYGPVLPPLPDELPEDEEAVRIVCLVKNKQPLGATIKRDETTGEIFIARVIHGGLADRSGLLHAGDKLMEVNGKSVEGLMPEQVIQILVNCHGNIIFKVIPNSPQPVNSQATLLVRAMADYSPSQDPSIPCPDAGMAFSKGDLLEIVDQTDSHWWQARKLPSTSACAGLIPSTSLFKSKQREFWWSQPYQVHTCIRPLSASDVGEDVTAVEEEKCAETDDCAVESEEDEYAGNMEGPFIAGFRNSLRLWRRKSQTKRKGSCHSCGSSSCYNSSPYEEVINYRRRAQDTPRLIALIGPSGVGVNELRRTLIQINPDKFQSAVPHTTRAPESNEQYGREYHFVSRELFQYMMCNHRFVECGNYKGHLYGTSIDAIKNVLDTGKICIIDIEPHSIRSIRTKTLKPYVIFVKPPGIERMRQSRRDAKILADNCTKRPFSDEDFEEIEESAWLLEMRYRQFFDCVIVNDTLQDACGQLSLAIQRAQEEAHWVPASWLSPDEP
ncbi:MAGUK p55 subfamily member 4 [Chanos chanos]|uniref:MAGUK p55 subfamily member 4 n=1 Tax=Chanos chanos TaxID=29144 RepID=A0A6J2WDX5_CHACN|nr:MAGUK p55 subfamily member 4-like [Chanos chanos]